MNVAPFGSPIEREFAAGVVELGLMQFVPKFELTYEEVRIEAPKLLGPRGQFDSVGVVVFPQVQIAKFTVDFLAMFWNHRRNFIMPIAIECDGHDFHERTPQQAWHDKRRDRFFALNSIFVLRFTGREIRRDPVECARELYRATFFIADGPSAQVRGESWLLSEAELEALEEEQHEAEMEEQSREAEEIEQFQSDEIMSGTYEGYWP
jgi:very-short-patch-repair endonuclease